MKVAVVGAGVGGLACAGRLTAAGHDVVVLEQGPAAGGKCARVELDGGFAFDAGPSLLTMPDVLRGTLAAVGAAPLELDPVEPVTVYRFADGTSVALSADLERSVEALEAWSPGAGADWRRFMAVCADMWRASEAFLSGPPPFPPRRDVRADPRDGLRVRPWHTLRTLARSCLRDPRLQVVAERFATYAGSDPRRAPAALALAGYVEHAFGAWHPRGGLYAIVERLVERAGDARFGARVVGVVRDGSGGRSSLRRPSATSATDERGRVRGVRLEGGEIVAADAVVWNGDALALRGALRGGSVRRAPQRSSSGLALLLGLRDAPPQPHHEIRFPADYDAEFDDLFVRRVPVRDPALYVCAPPESGGGWFVLVNAPSAIAADWEAEADRVVERLGVGDRVVARHVRSPDALARETGALGGAIYGAATHGRLGALRRPGHRVRGVPGLWRVGGTAHPGGGLPLVMLGAALVAREIGPA